MPPLQNSALSLISFHFFCSCPGFQRIIFSSFPIINLPILPCILQTPTPPLLALVLSHVRLFATPWTVVYQAPLSSHKGLRQVKWAWFLRGPNCRLEIRTLEASVRGPPPVTCSGTLLPGGAPWLGSLRLVGPHSLKPSSGSSCSCPLPTALLSLASRLLHSLFLG